MNSFRFQFPSFRLRFACATLRARATSKAIVCSAVVIVLPSGAFITTMPRPVAAATSMLSTPTPARPITRSFLAASINSAVTLVSLRTISASQARTPSRSASGARPICFSSTKPASRSGWRPLSLTSSVTRILVDSLVMTERRSLDEDHEKRVQNSKDYSSVGAGPEIVNNDSHARRERLELTDRIRLNNVEGPKQEEADDDPYPPRWQQCDRQ